MEYKDRSSVQGNASRNQRWLASRSSPRGATASRPVGYRQRRRVLATYKTPSVLFQSECEAVRGVARDLQGMLSVSGIYMETRTYIRTEPLHLSRQLWLAELLSFHNRVSGVLRG